MENSSKKKIIVIGAGFGGLAASALLAKKGFDVLVIEKNDQPGGRARIWEKDGFRFDMGPSWYWMPDVFEDYFELFGKKVSDFYSLQKLNPSYRVFFGDNDVEDVPAEMEDLRAFFEKHQTGSSKGLDEFLAQAKYKYEVGMKDYVFRPSYSIFEFIDWKVIIQSFKIQLFQSMRKHVRKFFSNEKLRKIVEFPVLFLGATPQNTPAMYSMMNYADLVLGTWYPAGGMNEIVKAMYQIALDEGVKFEFNSPVTTITTTNGVAKSVKVEENEFFADAIVSNGDYEHTEQSLLQDYDRTYSKEYWENRTMSPSSLLFYIGLNKKIKGVLHHNLFFDEDFELHAEEIYTDPKWPTKPLFYASCPSATDNTIAPEGCENLFFLIPLAPGLQDTDELREKYFQIILKRFEKLTDQSISDHIILKRSYAMNDFVKDYNSYKGNAYGLANTLLQTAFFKPRMRSKKVKNLFFTGQLTVPGPGVPPSIISGRVVADEVEKFLK